MFDLPLKGTVLCFSVLFASVAFGSVLRVGTKPVAPFAFEVGEDDPPAPEASAPWGGFSFDYFDELVWPILRDSTNFTSYEVTDFGDNTALIEAVRDGVADLGLAGTTITPAREAIVDFGTQFFTSSFQILIRNENNQADALTQVLGTVISLIAIFIGGVVCLVISTGLLLYVLEEIAPGDLPVLRLESPILGLWDAMNVATALVLKGGGMRSPNGKLSGVVAAICSGWAVLLPVLLTAVAAAALTSLELPRSINGFEDLQERVVVVGEDSTAEAYIRNNGPGIRLETRPSIAEALDAFFDGVGDAVVYDFGVLIFAARREKERTGRNDYAVVGEHFAPENYGMIVSEGNNDLREAVDAAILATWATAQYDAIYDRWLKPPDATTSELSESSQQGIALAVIGAALVSLGLLALILLLLARHVCGWKRIKQLPRTDTMRTATRAALAKLDQAAFRATSLRDSDLLYSVFQVLVDVRREQLDNRLRDTASPTPDHSNALHDEGELVKIA